MGDKSQQTAWNDIRRNLPLWAGALTIALCCSIAAERLAPFVQLEHALRDALTGLRVHPRPPDRDIVVIDIDEASLEAMSSDYGRFPWPREVYATLLAGIAQQRPAAIAFDILFTDPDHANPEGDRLWVEALAAEPRAFAPMVVLSPPRATPADGVRLRDFPAAVAPDPATDVHGRLLLPPLPVWKTGRVGAINMLDDDDGKVRRYLLYRDIDGWRIPSLPSRIGQVLGYKIPQQSDVALAWRSAPHTHVSFVEVFQDLERRKRNRPVDEFKNKIVLIGTSASGLHDLKITPLGSVPGVTLIATALDNLKHGDYLRTAPLAARLATPMLLLLPLAWGLSRRKALLPLGAVLVAMSAIALIVVVALLGNSVMLPLATALLGAWLYYFGAALNEYLRERRQRQRIIETFGRFLDPRVVADLVSHGQTTTSVSGQRRVVTVLFSDICGFTSLSERKPPQEIVDLLNHYFTLQVEAVFRHEGTLDKYIGDAIMAFWGAPTEQGDHALRAVRAARDMVAALEQFKRELGEAGQDFDMGIGVHTGEVVAGFIGSATRRQDYTVIGDTVNTASRIEGATRGRARVLVSAATRAACGEAFAFKDHGLVKVKGKEEQVHVYEPIFDN